MQSSFKYSTNTFRLHVTLIEGKLTVNLQDFDCWTVYERQYSDEDAGKGQIHKKVQISQIFQSMYQITNLNDQISVQSKQNQGCFRQYAFGTILKFQGCPCYKVQKGGKITVYVIYEDKKKKQEVSYQSHLCLNKIRDFSQQQIFKQRVLLQKKQSSNKFAKQLSVFKKQKQQTQLKLNVLLNEHEDLKKQLQVTKQKLENSIKSQRKSQQKLEQLEQKLSVAWMLRLPYLSQFKVNGPQFEYIGQNSKWTHFIQSSVKIPYGEPMNFRVKIIKLGNVNIQIAIGVVDIEKQRYARTSFTAGNAVAYYTSSPGSATKYPGGTIQGNGFTVGDIVQVQVNLANKTIKWIVNGAQRAIHTDQILGNQNRIFSPFVQIYHTNTVVQWL